MSAFSIKHSPATLHPLPKLPLVPTPVTPPKSPLTVSFTRLELSLVDVALLAGPVIDPPALFLIEPELPDVVVASCEVEFPLSLQLAVVELPADDLLRVLEVADAPSVRSAYLRLPDVDYFPVLEEFGAVETRFHAQHHGTACLDCQQLFELQFDGSQLTTDKAGLVVEVVQVELRLFQHLLL
jgi:hypothetical protein